MQLTKAEYEALLERYQDEEISYMEVIQRLLEHAACTLAESPEPIVDELRGIREQLRELESAVRQS